MNDLWDYRHTRKHAIVIPTNGEIKKTGEAVMGAGLARQAACQYPMLALELGRKMAADGNHVYWFPDRSILTFPTKHEWRKKADLDLIEQSARELADWFLSRNRSSTIERVAMPKVGAGLGGLSWEEVKDRLIRVWSPTLLQYIDFVE